MKIVVNGEEKEILSGLTMLDYLHGLAINIQTVACEVNGVIIKREHFQNAVLNEHDRIEIVNFVGGG